MGGKAPHGYVARHSKHSAQWERTRDWPQKHTGNKVEMSGRISLSLLLRVDVKSLVARSFVSRQSARVLVCMFVGL